MANKRMNMTIDQRDLFMAEMGKVASVDEAKAWLHTWLRTPLEGLRAYFSRCLEKEVSMRQTLLIIQAQVAFLAAAFPADISLWLRAACGAWLVMALKACGKALR